MSKPAKHTPTSSPKNLRSRSFRRQPSVSEEPIHVKNLRETLNFFPQYDLASRGDFVESEVVQKTGNISGRTRKKVVQFDAKEYLLKKNAREQNKDGIGAASKSADMDLEKNHMESFNEICALRLFQLIWGAKDATPEDTKIVLSEFDSKKVANLAKQEMTKVYFASQKIDGLNFDVARLSVQNKEALTNNQDLKDALCEQTIIQCILSNPDAIKFDNFFVDVASKKVRHFDFGDARHDEFLSPDPLAMLDSIRTYRDPSSSKSVQGMFSADNVTYSSALKFFHENISPKHILAVIDKLEKLSEKDLWQVAYVYTYGDDKAKRDYADCLVARAKNMIALKNAAAEFQQTAEGIDKFKKMALRDVFAGSESYKLEKQQDEIIVNVREMLEAVNECVDEVFVNKKSDSSSSNSSESRSSSGGRKKDDDEESVIFEGSGDDVSSRSSESESSKASDKEDVSDSEDESEESGESNSESEEEDSESEKSREASEEEESDESQASQTQDENYDESENEDKLSRAKESRDIIIKNCEELKNKLSETQTTLLTKGVSGKFNVDPKLAIDPLLKKVSEFYGSVKAVVNYDNGFEKSDVEKHITEEGEKVRTAVYNALTYKDSYQSLENVRAMNYGENIAARKEEVLRDVRNAFVKIGVVDANAPRTSSAELQKTLEKINGAAPSEPKQVGRSL